MTRSFRHGLALVLLLVAAVGCAKNAPDRVGPAPETKATTTPPPPPLPSDLVLSDVRCQYGGTAPAFFVWMEATTSARISGLRARSYEVATKGGAFVSGTSSTIDVRTRPEANGVGNITYLKAPIDAGAKLHLEVFGPLATDAVFGKGVGYPSEDRAFRVELVADQGTWTVTGKCVVGPAG